MAISSASTQRFQATDPVMETDLSLLAKVNEYQQDKFDAGEKNLQNEINNWSLLSKVAKPQDREYINQKLNTLVSGIKNMGGVDLSDPNNVNQLKSLGYSLYGDDNVMNAVLTTRKMEALQQDISAKTNGKNAKNYDSVNGEYLMNQYSDWLNDGKQGTKFDGPTSLPQGSFDQYSKKINDGIEKLKPDINDAPVNDKDAEFNYYQVSGKFLRKDRIKAFIDANTSGEDRAILQAHGWKSMQSLSDAQVLDLQGRDYKSALVEMQNNRNWLVNQLAQNPTAKQKQILQSQINDLYDSDTKTGAIADVNKQLQSLPQLQEGQQLPKEVRQGLTDSLFYNAYKNGIASTQSYEQDKTELKTNTGKIAARKIGQVDYWHGKDYNLKVDDYNLKVKEFGLKEQEAAFKQQTAFMKFYGLTGQGGAGGFYGGGGQNSSLSLLPVKGKDDALKLTNDVNTQALATYTAASTKFYTGAYNLLMSKDPGVYGKYMKQDSDGNWVPKDTNGPATKAVHDGIDVALNKVKNAANMSIKERQGLVLTDDDRTLFQNNTEMEEAALYKNQISQLTGDVFRSSGKEDPNTKTISIKLKNGTLVPYTYAQLKEMIDRKDPALDNLREQAEQSQGYNQDLSDKKDDEISALRKKYKVGAFGKTTKAYDDELNKINEKYSNISTLGELKEMIVGVVSPYNTVDSAISEVNNYYSDSKVQDAWDNISKTINPYARNISLPFKDKKGEIPDIAATTLIDAITDESIKKDVDKSAIDLVKVWPRVDMNKGTTTYMGTVRYRKATKGKDTKESGGDKYTDVDLTNVVTEQQKNGGGWISGLYASDNESVVMGLAINKNGQTPFNPSDNYEGALQTHSNADFTHKYQIVAIPDPVTKGTVGYKVFIAIPTGVSKTGKPQFLRMAVPNFRADASGKQLNFPPVFEGVRSYMDSNFQDDASTNDFYQRLGIPYNK